MRHEKARVQARHGVLHLKFGSAYFVGVVLTKKCECRGVYAETKTGV
jgi:hypothetical protein